MERFAKRHRQTLNELLGSDSGQSPSDSTLRLLLAQLVVTGLVTLLRNWMAAQPGMAIAQTTYATDASSEIQALGQLLEAVALEGVLVLCCSSNTSAIRSTKPATPRWWAQPAHGGLAGAQATSQQAAHRSSWLIRQQGLRGIEAGNNHPNAHAGHQSETPFTRKAVYALSQQAAQQTLRLIVNLYYLRSKVALLKHRSL